MEWHQKNDILGVFVNNECRAISTIYTINNETSYADLNIYGTIPEQLSFQLWDASQGMSFASASVTQSAPGSTIGTAPNYIKVNVVSILPVTNIVATDEPNDNGGQIHLSYTLSANDPDAANTILPRISYYSVERYENSVWEEVRQIATGTNEMTLEVASTGTECTYRINAVYDPTRSYLPIVASNNNNVKRSSLNTQSRKICSSSYRENERSIISVSSSTFSVAEQDNLPAYATVKVLLEGAYKTQTHTMSRTRALTMASPYGQSETVSAITYANASNPVIDWVGVQVRNSNNQIVNLSGANAAGFVSRLLLADGSIVNIDGSSTYPMFYTTGKNYSFVIKTRNHLSVMSAQNHTVADLGSCVIDLTTSGSIYGPAHKTIDSKEMLVVGDINASNNVTVQDYLLVKNNLGTAVDNRL